MMDGTAVKEIADLAKAGQSVAQVTGGVAGRPMSTVALFHVQPRHEPEPTALGFSSLQALVGYVAANRDGLELGECVVHVASPQQVLLLGPLTGEKKQRFVYANATCKNIAADFTDRFHGHEAMVIGLQARFTADGDRAKVLALLGRIKQEGTTENLDDGTSQEVTVRAGVTLVGTERVPNPVTLAPFRTFREVEQPESGFVLRVQKGPQVGLFEADGGAWMLTATRRVAEWLMAALEPVNDELPVLA